MPSRETIRRAVVTFIVWIGHATAAQAAETSIIGDWFEDEFYGGQRTIAVAHFVGDGTFSVDFRTCLKPGFLDHTETGHYTYSGGALHMTTETNNGFWTYSIEEYRTISNTGKLWIYKSVAGDNFKAFGEVTFHDVRVGAGSKPPTCDLTS